MAAKFYDGASLKATRSLAQADKTPPPQKNSMKGLPGFIKTGQDASDAGLKDRTGMGPHREGPIGKRAHPGDAHYSGKYADNGKFRGSSDKSYRATSTGAAGKVVSNKGEPERRKSSEKEGPARGKPKSGFHQSNVYTKHFAPGGVGAGHPGRMESLRGRARTSWEK